MEKLSLNYHLRLQEMCDCYMETDFSNAIQSMAGVESEDPEEHVEIFVQFKRI